MSDSTDISTGLAGSLVMIILCTAVTFLLISFYRRYKRVQEKEIHNSGE
ncbi:MAG: hypothetical protein WCG53_02500 [Actinomycetes bacterium]